MPEATAARSRTLSWVNAIPLRSLDQLQGSRVNTLFATGTTTARNIPLPDSTRSAGSSRTTLGALAQQTPIPPSESGSVASNQSSDSGLPTIQSHSVSAGSLVQLQHATGNTPSTQPVTLDSIPPHSAPASAANTPTPSARPGSNIGHTSPQVTQQTTQQPNYWTRIAPIAECLPHLEPLTDPARSRWRSIGKVSCIDYVHGDNAPRTHAVQTVNRFTRRTPDWSTPLQDLRTTIAPDIVNRFILVEDLSDQLLEALGSTFDIDPDFFAMHLFRSGYGETDYDDPPIKHWARDGLRKPCASLTWMRPVNQNPKLSEWLDKPEMLLDERTAKLKDGSVVVERGISWRVTDTDEMHRVDVDNNIFRRNWGLSAVPPNSIDIMSTNLSGGAQEPNWSRTAIPTAWEERVTAYTYGDAAVPIGTTTPRAR